MMSLTGRRSGNTSGDETDARVLVKNSVIGSGGLRREKLLSK